MPPRNVAGSNDGRDWELVAFRIGMWAVAVCSLAAIAAKARWGRPASAPVHYLLALAVGSLLLAVVVPRLQRSLDESGWELMAFRTGMWGVAACSFVGIFTKARWGQPASVPIYHLLILTTAATLLAVLVPKVEPYVLSKLRKISVGGVELELGADVMTAIEWLKYEEVPPRGPESDSAYSYPADRPFPVAELTGPQRYQYEKLSHRLSVLFCQVSDLDSLEPRTRGNCRQLIRYVGAAAIAMKHFTKSLDILLHLKRFGDGVLDPHELKLLGSAYLWAADELTVESKKQAYWREATLLLKGAAQADPFDARVPYNLGWALLSLGVHEEGIERMKESMRLDQSVAAWARWNIACGQKKLGRATEALETLELIPAGPWWKYIKDDDWFKGDQPTSFVEGFRRLCESRIEEYDRRT